MAFDKTQYNINPATRKDWNSPLEDSQEWEFEDGQEWEAEEIDLKTEIKNVLELMQDWEFKEAEKSLKELIKTIQ